ncbi:type I restriction enzyme, S subunit [Asanoa hainanensis]|uniref:Type I restriction enzyme, S subunit n=1 Tax=Asanoa hainanensis TaxID=560556 RepID=A0A239H7X4_9ACTN|nr:restriction endonuclease subunit S [Asanoa hainanensis]SNS77271.1 type I restriction enzyme, S subunit [Asanoa hainanensis]
MSSDLLPLRRITKVINGGTPSPDDANWNGDVPWATPADFGAAFAPITATRRTLTALGAKVGSTIVPAGAILLSTRAPIGYVALASTPMAFNQGCRALVLNDNVDPRFIGYQLESMRPDLQARGLGTTFVELSSESLASVPVVIPPLREQQRIADFLDGEIALIDRLQIATQRQISLMVERRGAAFHHAIEIEGGPGLDILSPRAEADHWDMVPLNQALTQLTNGYVGPTRDILVDQGVPYLQSLHIKDGRVDFERRPYFVSADWARERPRISLGIGDVLIVQTGAIGEVAIVDERSAGASCHALLIARANKAILDPTYLWHALRSHWGRNILLREQTGALHPHLEAGNVRFINLPIADLRTQRRVVERVDEVVLDMKRVERLLGVRLNLQTERRRSLITAAVTGQVDVSTASGRGIEG